MAVEENDRSFVKSLLQLPIFQEAGLDEVALTPEEEAENRAGGKINAPPLFS